MWIWLVHVQVQQRIAPKHRTTLPCLASGLSPALAGLSLAQYALSKRDKVIAATRDITKIPSSIEKAHHFPLDPGSSSEDIKAAVGQATSVYGTVDVLVNMAAYALTSSIEYLDEKELQNQFQVNVFGPISLIQAVIPVMRKQKSGHILNVSSIAGFSGGPPFGAYNASKAALDAFTETLGKEVAPFNIRVLSIVPGYFPTNFFDTARATQRGDRTGEYTLPEQGADVFETYHQMHLEQEQIGDAAKAGIRIWEIVAGEGLASGLVVGQSERIPLGPDSSTRMKTKINALQKMVDKYERISNSTDVEKERLREFS